MFTFFLKECCFWTSFFIAVGIPVTSKLVVFRVAFGYALEIGIILHFVTFLINFSRARFFTELIVRVIDTVEFAVAGSDALLCG